MTCRLPALLTCATALLHHLTTPTTSFDICPAAAVQCALCVVLFAMCWLQACLRWHPDRFMAQHGTRVVDALERQRMRARVVALCQAINSEWGGVVAPAPAAPRPARRHSGSQE